MLPRILSPTTSQQSPELVSRVQEIMLATSLEGVLGDLEALKNRPDSTPLLNDIRLPTLILPGEQDQIVPLAEAHAMQAAIPGARLKPIPQAGHLPNLENSALFNAYLREFIQLLQSSEEE
jgi:pimeloyl-ACP methyl ester carboxylesterase